MNSMQTLGKIEMHPSSEKDRVWVPFSRLLQRASSWCGNSFTSKQGIRETMGSLNTNNTVNMMVEHYINNTYHSNTIMGSKGKNNHFNCNEKMDQHCIDVMFDQLT